MLDIPLTLIYLILLLILIQKSKSFKLLPLLLKINLNLSLKNSTLSLNQKSFKKKINKEAFSPIHFSEYSPKLKKEKTEKLTSFSPPFKYSLL
jgi:hypothetical protein